MNQSPETHADAVVEVLNDDGHAEIVHVCEYVSCAIPNELDNLVHNKPALTSHASFDIGAARVSKAMCASLDAPLVAFDDSLLFYDSNRTLDGPDAMLVCTKDHCDLETSRNEPDGPDDGATHTLPRHALAHGRLNVMLEIRNDLTPTRDAQNDMAAMMSGGITDALSKAGRAA